MIRVSALFLAIFASVNFANAFAAPVQKCYVPNINPGHSIAQAVGVSIVGQLASVVLANSGEAPQRTRYRAEILDLNDPMAKVFVSEMPNDPACASVDGYGLLAPQPSRARYAGAVLTCEDNSGNALYSYLAAGFAFGKCE